MLYRTNWVCQLYSNFPLRSSVIERSDLAWLLYCHGGYIRMWICNRIVSELMCRLSQRQGQHPFSSNFSGLRSNSCHSVFTTYDAQLGEYILSVFGALSTSRSMVFILPAVGGHCLNLSAAFCLLAFYFSTWLILS